MGITGIIRIMGNENGYARRVSKVSECGAGAGEKQCGQGVSWGLWGRLSKVSELVGFGVAPSVPDGNITELPGFPELPDCETRCAGLLSPANARCREAVQNV